MGIAVTVATSQTGGEAGHWPHRFGRRSSPLLRMPHPQFEHVTAYRVTVLAIFLPS